ncbi:MAG: aldolase [Methanotrichaceae archaeon]|nr:aldolase [Methanotrichaceae archaeon]
MPESLVVPLDVPGRSRHRYIDNYLKITCNSGRLMLFAGDQKVEHLNDDFYGPQINQQDNNPAHLFNIAAKSRIGVFATQLGLIARYGMDYPEVPYLVKLNSKTNLVKTSQDDPISSQWFDVQQVIDFRDDSGLEILGIGYTIYLGGEKEDEMLSQAAKLVYEAHRNGLVTVLWMYPRGKAVKDEKDPHLIAGATGVAAALGSDFVKVNYPQKPGLDSAIIFREAVQSAGRTKVICAGGPSQDVGSFLLQIYNQIHISGAAGNATGRNVHQKSLEDAIGLCNAIFALTVEDAGVDEALKIYSGD